MGRIEDALKRAASERSGSVSPPTAEDDRILTPFVSPWQGGEQQSDRTFARTKPTEKPVIERPPLVPMRGHGERTSGPSLQLDSLIAMGWPQPFAADVAGKLVVIRGIDPAAREQYRRLAAAVRQAASERGIKSVLVASPGNGDGKTLTAVNLALASSGSDQHVVLIDADMQAPRVHQIFQVSAGSGLAGCLKSEGPVTLPVVEITETLSLLPAGAPPIDPAALSSERMRRVLAEASQRFDLIVVDSGPAMAPHDPALLTSIADTVVVVVDAERTSRIRALQLIEAIGRDRVMGVVFNRAWPKTLA
jgi:capsular exopolysaccharide synthesis family protein